MIRPVLFLVPMFALIACSPREEDPPTEAESRASTSASVSASRAADVAAGYVGRWTGPEGSSLEVVARQHDYEVSISGVQVGPGVFTGTVEGDALRIERNGEAQTIRHTTGPRTGIKYLADKKDCVLISSGEGFCRD
ncbi:MAG: hypothetical protein QM667_02580 [Asticcacaulis sp.]